MFKRMIIPLIIGLAGIAVLVSLGTWQVKRMAWKADVLNEIETEIVADPIAMPATLSPDLKYTPVTATGTIGTDELHVLVSQKHVGAGYRVIAPFELQDGRRVLLDRGFIKADTKDTPRAGAAPIEVTGNLHWPDDMNSSTPAPDVAKNIWFGRDLAAMAAALGTQEVLIVARSHTGNDINPLPVGVTGIPNDHFHYAITWFSLALVWFGMTLFLLWRIKNRTV
jgi:surfeit locus 1 family protein